jgi:hypothetical protein
MSCVPVTSFPVCITATTRVLGHEVFPRSASRHTCTWERRSSVAPVLMVPAFPTTHGNYATREERGPGFYPFSALISPAENGELRSLRPPVIAGRSP